MKIEKDGSLTITENQEGIGQSLLSDFSDMLGVNISNPGIFSVGYKFTRLIETKASKNFVIATAGDDYFTLSPADTSLYRNIAVKLTTTGTLPTGLNTTDVFYLWDVNNDGTTFRFRDKLDGDGSTNYIDLSNTGSGTHSFTVLVPQIVKGYTFDSNLNLYILDSEQRVWFSQPITNYQTFYLIEGNTSAGAGNGIIYYAGYILVFGNAKIDALAEINSPSTVPSWDNDFASATSITSSATFPANGAVPFYSQYDNAIYFGNGNPSGSKGVFRVGLLEENVGETFDPGDTDTFSCVADAIEIPYAANLGYVQSINESGEYIILGTGSNTIYYWDRKSILPISVVNMPENNTKSIIVKGSNILAFNGSNGKFYQITHSDYGEVIDIPEHLFDTYYTKDGSYTGDRVHIEYTDATLFLDEVIFSIEVNGKSYLMAYNTKTRAIYKKNISSYGETLTDSGSVGRINKIISLAKTNYNSSNILVSTSKRSSGAWYYTIEGYQFGSSDAVHKVYDNYEAYFTTGLTAVGEPLSKKTFRELHISLTRALTTGQGVRVSYRTDDSSSFTVIKTIDYATDGAIKDIKVPSPITDVIDLQIKVEMKGYNSDSATGTSPFLKLIRLIP